MARDYIWINGEREEMIFALPDEQVTELFRDLYHYVSAGTMPDRFSSQEVKQAFETMMNDDAEMYRSEVNET